MRLTATRLAPVLGTLVLATASAQHTGQPTGLRMFFEVGMKRNEMPKLLDLAESAGAPKMPDEVRRLLAGLDQKSLPATLRFFVPKRFDRRRDPPFGLFILDSEREIEVERMIARLVPAAPGGAGGDRLLLKQIETPKGFRYAIGKRHPVVAAAIERLERGEDFKAPANARRFRQRVAAKPLFALIDTAAILTDRGAAKLRAAGGPLATLFAAGIDRKDGDWVIDVHWGARPGAGFVGSLLPRKAGPGTLHRLMPWRPSVMFEVNLGSGFARTLQGGMLGMLLRGIAPSERSMLGEVLSSFGGEVGVFQPEAPEGYEADRLAPAILAMSDRFCVALRVDPERATDLLAKWVRKAGGFRFDERRKSWRHDTRLRSLHVAHQAGLVVLCGAPDADAAARDLAAVLETARTGKLHDWAVDKRLADPIRLVISREAARRSVARLRRRSGNHAPHSPFEFGQQVGRRLIENGYGVSLGWNATGVRMRLRF